MLSFSMVTAPRSFWLLAAAEGLMAAGYAVSFPFLAVYLTSERGMSLSAAGLFLSASLLITSAGHFAGGVLSDAAGRRKVMLFSMSSRAVLTALLAAAIFAELPLIVLFLVHPAGLLCGSLFHPAANAWIADNIPRQRRLKYYGLLRMGNNAGWAAGPALGGFLAAGSYSLMFSATAAIYAVCSVLLFSGVKDSAQFSFRAGFSFSGMAGMASALRDRFFLRFCLIAFLIGGVISQLVVSSSLYARNYMGLDDASIGMLFSINGLVVVGLQYFISRALEKKNIAVSLAAGSLVYGAGWLLFGFSHTFAAAAAAMVVVTLGEIVVAPGLQAFAAATAPPSRRGSYMGVQGIFQQAGSSAGIFAGSSAIGLFSPLIREAPWFITGAAAAAAAAGFFSLRSGVSAASGRSALTGAAAAGTAEA